MNSRAIHHGTTSKSAPAFYPLAGAKPVTVPTGRLRRSVRWKIVGAMRSSISRLTRTPSAGAQPSLLVAV
jgi:hypothetical protein